MITYEWHSTTVPDPGGALVVGVNPTLAVAVSMSSDVTYYSTDGITFTKGGNLPAPPNGFSPGGWIRPVWNGTVFCTARAGTYQAATSPDGLVWTVRGLTLNKEWSAMAWNGSTYCLMSGFYTGSRYCLTSPDGSTWTTRTPDLTKPCTSIASNGTIFVALSGSWNGYAYGTCQTSTDGVSWTQRTMSANKIWAGVVWNGTMFFAVANDGTTSKSVDGITWEAAGLIAPLVGEVKDVAWNGTMFAAVCSGGKIFVSADGTTWTSEFTTGLIPQWYQRVIAFGDKFLVHSGSVQKEFLYSGPLTLGVPYPLADLVIESNGFDGPQRNVSINGQITFDGGSPITSYSAVSTPEGRTFTNATLPIVASGLLPETEYTFQVTATNANGTGNPSTSPPVTTVPDNNMVMTTNGQALIGKSDGYSPGHGRIAVTVVHKTKVPPNGNYTIELNTAMDLSAPSKTGVIILAALQTTPHPVTGIASTDYVDIEIAPWFQAVTDQEARIRVGVNGNASVANTVSYVPRIWGELTEYSVLNDPGNPSTGEYNHIYKLKVEGTTCSLYIGNALLQTFQLKEEYNGTGGYVGFGIVHDKSSANENGYVNVVSLKVV